MSNTENKGIHYEDNGITVITEKVRIRLTYTIFGVVKYGEITSFNMFGKEDATLEECLKSLVKDAFGYFITLGEFLVALPQDYLNVVASEKKSIRQQRQQLHDREESLHRVVQNK